MSERTRPPVAVLNTAGLTPGLLRHMPQLHAVGEQGFVAPLDTVLPAVGATTQATFMTGLLPRDHGVVGTSWYLRKQGLVMMRSEHSALVTGETVWESTKAGNPGQVNACVGCDWAIGAAVNVMVAPTHRHLQDYCHALAGETFPPSLHAELTARFGAAPLVRCGRDPVGIAETRWIAHVADHVLRSRRPDLSWIQIPYLEHQLQRCGPSGSDAVRAAMETDAALAPLLDGLRDAGTTVLVLSGHTITPVRRAVPINRVLRHEGLLSVRSTDGGEYPRLWDSQAFAVTDRQTAHVYVSDPADLPRVQQVLLAVAGVDHVLDQAQQADFGLDHPNSGELLAVAEPDAWFCYDYWLDDASAPVRGVQPPHRRQGVDPTLLLAAPGDPAARLDPGLVRGSHGRLPEDSQEGPLLLCSDPSQEQARFHATEVKDLVLRLGGPAR